MHDIYYNQLHKRAYLIMEFMEGKSLEDVVKDKNLTNSNQIALLFS